MVLVDKDDWQAGVTASVLASRPTGYPVLISDGDELPAVTEDTLKRLKPTGSDLAKDAQVVRIGDKPPRPDGYKTAVLNGDDPYERAGAIDRFFSAARGKPSANVVVASGEKAEFAMPAAAWAARSGDSVLLTKRDSLPAATAKAIKAHPDPNIYVLGPPAADLAQGGHPAQEARQGGADPGPHAGHATRSPSRATRRAASAGAWWCPGYNFTVAGPRGRSTPPRRPRWPPAACSPRCC